MQVSPAEERAGLDAELAAPGLDARRADRRPGGGRRRRRSERRRPARCALTDRPDAGWVAAWAACEERPDADEHARAVLARIEPATAYARAAEDLGVGLAVCERGWAGLFCVATAAGARRRGIAGHVVHALTSWAVERGARRLYLQVESANAPAHAFYERAGFTRSHGYHYRAAPRRGAAV